MLVKLSEVLPDIAGRVSRMEELDTSACQIHSAYHQPRLTADISTRPDPTSLDLQNLGETGRRIAALWAPYFLWQGRSTHGKQQQPTTASKQ